MCGVGKRKALSRKDKDKGKDKKMNYKNGDKVVTTGNIPHDNTKCVKAGLKGVVIGRDTDGKYKVAIDGETEPWYLAEHEIKRELIK